MNNKTSLRPGRNRSNKAIAEEEKFKENLPILFDISRSDAKVHLSEEDFFFLNIKEDHESLRLEKKQDIRKTCFSKLKSRRLHSKKV